MSGMSKKTYLRDVNPYLTCPLCRGYLIDATTVVECLHSFCRSCILKHLESEAHCPSCKDVLNKAKPNIKADNTLQDIVYKLVPGLYHKEMKRRKEFYVKHPEHGYAESPNHLQGAESATPEQRGEDASSRLFFAPEDAVSLSLEYLPPDIDPMNIVNAGEGEAALAKLDPKLDPNTGRRYLQCPALVTIAHLKKFLANKYNIDVTRHNIEICQRKAALPEYMTLMDVAYIYAWKRNAPMRFFYVVTQHEHILEAPTNERPSTPGLGASFPPAEDAKQDNTEEKSSKKKINNEEITPVGVSNKSLEKSKKADSSERQKAATTESEKKTVKTPIKILKTSNGSYEVLKSSKSSPKAPEQVQPDDAKSKLKRSSPESNGSTKLKVISDVLIDKRIFLKNVKEDIDKTSGTNKEKQDKTKTEEKEDKQHIKEEIVKTLGTKKKQDETETKEKEAKPEKKNEKQEKIERAKRKVTFKEDCVEAEAAKLKSSTSKPADQPDKKQFLQSFELTANENRKKPSEAKADGKATSSPNTKIRTEDKPIVSIMKDSPDKRAKKMDKCLKSNSQEKTTVNSNSTNADVYAFPSEPSVMLSGAIKRKCPPGLMITDVPLAKKVALQTPAAGRKKPVPFLLNSAKSYRKLIKDAEATLSKSPNPSMDAGPSSFNKTLMSLSDTKSLLDECGLNIPAGLSITLTSPRPSTNPYSSFDNSPVKDHPLNAMIVEKVSPKISLNNKSVDPQALKAFKMGQVKPSTPTTSTSEICRSPKQKKEPGILDLSSVKSLDVQQLPRLKIPQPMSKFKVKKTNATKAKSQQQHGQIVTVIGGHKYYRTPPGSLTPAPHRDLEFLSPTSNRSPVYAPSCLGTPTNSSISPSFQSLYMLNQSPTLQQFQMDKFKLMQIPENPGRSHLAAQCAPIKPPRSSQTSLAVPIPKQSSNSANLTIKKLLANDAKMDLVKHVTFEKPTAVPSSSPNNSQNVSQAGAPFSTSPELKSTASPCSDQNSPRVSSTVSPSPPPNLPGSSGIGDSSSEVSKEKTATEVIKSPESPDSSSTVAEKESANVGDEKHCSPEVSQSEKLRIKENVEKDLEAQVENEKLEGESKESQSPGKNAIFQERLLAAFPSREWNKNPKAAEHFGNLMRSLSDQEEEKTESNESETRVEDKPGKKENAALPPVTQASE